MIDFLRRMSFQNAVIVAFCIFQVADGYLTYWSLGNGIIEDNPLLAYLITHVGSGLTLVVAKSMAVGFSIFLHLKRQHGWLALLTFVYAVVVMVIWPLALLALYDFI